MNSDRIVIIVNVVLAVGIAAALLFAWWVGRLNRQLQQKNEQERKGLTIEESVAEENGEPDSLS